MWVILPRYLQCPNTVSVVKSLCLGNNLCQVKYDSKLYCLIKKEIILIILSVHNLCLQTHVQVFQRIFMSKFNVQVILTYYWKCWGSKICHYDNTMPSSYPVHCWDRSFYLSHSSKYRSFFPLSLSLLTHSFSLLSLLDILSTLWIY